MVSYLYSVVELNSDVIDVIIIESNDVYTDRKTVILFLCGTV